MKVKTFLPVFFVIYLGILVNTQEIQDEKDPLLTSLNNIVSKVQAIKARLDKTLNETSSSGTLENARHSVLIGKGYKLTPKVGYHKFYTRELNWYDAFHHCRGDKAFLAVINSTEEADVSLKLLNY